MSAQVAGVMLVRRTLRPEVDAAESALVPPTIRAWVVLRLMACGVVPVLEPTTMACVAGGAAT